MANESIRPAAARDIPALRSLWARVFGDSEEYIDRAFSRLALPEKACVLTLSGRIVSAMYIIETAGAESEEGKAVPACYLYALATAPEYRRRGYGAHVVSAAADMAFDLGFDIAMLAPAGESLFPFYERLGFSTFGTYDEISLSFPKRELPCAELFPAEPEDYFSRREALLSGVPHVRLTRATLSQQLEHCRASGLGFYFSPSGCVIAAERQNGAVIVKEALGPGLSPALIALAKRTNAERITVRAPGSGHANVLAKAKPGARLSANTWMPFVLD